MTVRTCVALMGLLVAATHAAAAQDSQFGVRGLGMPGRPESVRARSTGGAFAAFDATSMLAEATLADVQTLTATAAEGTSYRALDLPGSSVNLRGSGFPLFNVAGALGSHAGVSGGFTSYLNNSYDIVTRDSVVLGGAFVPYDDESASDGGVSDARVAVAYRFGRRFALGVGVHAITGSTRLTTTRAFDDSVKYATVVDTAIVRYTGFGASASARLDVSASISVAGFARTDGHLARKVGGASLGPTDLPTTLGGAVLLILGPGARVAGSVVWRSWADAGPDAYNTLDWSAGAELGSRGLALRFGARGGKLPFGPGGSQPTEWGVSGGVGRTFAGGHGALDFGLERLSRSGVAAKEAVWTALVGLTVRQ